MAVKLFSCVYGGKVIPQRYILAFMTFMAIVNCYNTRMCLHIAITEIAVPTNELTNTVGECPGDFGNQTIKGGKQNWTEHEQGIILMSFFPGYLVMHLPGGMLADKYGGRHVLSSGVLISGVITILTPLTIQKLSYHWLVFSRFVLGLGQASMYPAITALLSRWIPERERSFLGSLVYSGIQVGIVTGTLFTGLIIHQFHSWPLSFYIWGLMCIVWYVFFLLMCFSEPSAHPFITEEEATMLDKEIGRREKLKTPWKAILKDTAVWALILAQCGHDWITYLVEMCMPRYFKNVLKFDVAQNGIITSVPFIGMWFCSAITGWISDRLINKHEISIATMRKLYTTISSAGPSILALVATYMGCNKYLVVTFFWVGLISMGPYYPGLKVNVLDLSHNFSGLLMSLANGIGVITGIIAPYLVAVMAAEQKIEQWQNVFWVTFFICTVTNVIYIIWGSGTMSAWDHSAELAEE